MNPASKSTIRHILVKKNLDWGFREFGIAKLCFLNIKENPDEMCLIKKVYLACFFSVKRWSI
jgi:hypothetical protein